MQDMRSGVILVSVLVTKNSRYLMEIIMAVRSKFWLKTGLCNGNQEKIRQGVLG